MSKLRQSNPLLADIEPYDPKYLPARVMISANENTTDVPASVRAEALDRLQKLSFNRYPEPLANGLRDAIAAHWGVARENVLCGNGGDELLFDLALAWGGQGNAFLNLPPTFSVYANNAQLTGTQVVDVPRHADYSIDEDAVIERAARGDIGYTIITSPNNPTGDLARYEFVERLLDATDALVIVDEAYEEFADEGSTVLPLLAKHENLCILRTFSKAYALAGVRMGYLLTSPRVVSELTKVRQPYSVDAVSQTIATVVMERSAEFQPVIDRIKEQRGLLAKKLAELPGVSVHPSQANFLLVKFDVDAHRVWESLYDKGVLVRDFSGGTYTKNCLRISVGTPEENRELVDALKQVLESER